MADQGKAPDRSSGAPQRAPDAIVRDITGERAELVKAFETLRGDLGEARDAASERATEVARKAAVVVPVVAAVVTVTVGGLAGGILALRRRRK